MPVTRMKAAILVENHRSLEVAEIGLPEELGYGQVLVKVHYSGICGSQLNEIDAVKGPDKFLPHLLGHEGSGTVIAVGPGVKRLATGQRVVMHWRESGGIQSETPAYSWGGRRVNAGWVTTFNEYAIVSENRLTPISDDVDLRLAPLFGCAVTTAMGVINNDAQAKIGQSVVVFGVGGVGLNIVQAAHLVSAHPVIGIDLVEMKLELAKRFGATHTLKASAGADMRGAIRAIVGTAGADVVIDTTGNPRVIEQAYELTHADGRTVLVGVPKQGDVVSLYTLPLHFKKVLKGSHGGSARPDVDIPRYVRLMQAGRLRLDGYVTHEFSLDRINEAIDLVRRGTAGRCLIAMEPRPA